MIELVNAIKSTLPLVVNEWNSNKLKQLELYVEKPFKEYFENRETQEKTKMVSPAIDAIFNKIMCSKINDFKIDEGKGRDYKYNQTPLECKTTLSCGNSWTGNGYKKTDYHILFRLEMDENGYITSYFSMLVNLNECESSWTEPTLSSNFSTLKFLNNDLDKITFIHGNMTKKRKYMDCVMIPVNKTIS